MSETMKKKCAFLCLQLYSQTLWSQDNYNHMYSMCCKCAVHSLEDCKLFFCIGVAIIASKKKMSQSVASLASWMASCTAAKIYAVQFVPEKSANS